MKTRRPNGSSQAFSEDTLPPPRSNRWRPLLIAGGLFFLVLLLPSIAANTPLLGWGVGQAASGMNAQVTVGSASLGWFSPIVLKDVRVLDAEGEPVAEIPTLRVSKSLLGLLQNSKDLGTVELTQPVLHVTVFEGTSNLERLFPPEEPDDGESSSGASSPTRLRVVLRQGAVHLADGNTSQSWILEDVAADLDWRDPTVAPPCNFSASLKQRERIGMMQGKGTLPGEALDSKLSIVAKGVPLGVLELIGTRMGTPLAAEGEVTGQVDLVTTPAGPALHCNLEAGNIGVRLLDAGRGQGWTGGMLRATGEIAMAGSQLLAKQFTVTTDWGQMLLHGNIPAGLASASPNAAPASLLGDQPWEVRGTVDIARLANAFPELLQVREGAELNEGRVTLNLSNQVEGGQSAVRGSALVSNIVATVDGRQNQWQQPLELGFAVSMPEGQLRLDQVQCQSSFLSASGKTSGQQTDVQFKIDWDRLASDLSRFVDLHGNQVAGLMEGSLRVEDLGAGRLALAVTAEGTDIQWAQGAQVLISEAKLNAQAQSTLVWNAGAVQQIESAMAMLKTDQTSVTVQTAGSVLLGENAVWPIKMQLQGPMAPVWTQLRYLTPLADHDLAGHGYLLAKLTMAGERWTIDGINVDVNDFALTGPLTQIHEPKLKIEGGATLDWAANHLAAPQFTVVGTTFSARATELAVPLGSAGTASGQVAYRVDLSRGIHWVLPPEWLGDNRVAGEMAGTMSLAKSDEGFVVQNSGQIKNWQLTVPSPAAPGGSAGARMQPASNSNQALTWNEPNLAYAQSISLNHQEDALAIHTCQLQSSALQLSANGGLGRLSTVGQVAINGQASYDWARLAPLVQAVMGSQVTIQGQRTSRFQWNGPLWPGDGSTAAVVTLSPTWEGTGELSWKQADIYGLPVGETTVNAELRQGVLRLMANSPELSGGQLALQSNLMLNSTPIQWQLQRGRVVDNVAITPLMCQGWLRYMAPIVADATRVEGRFSLDVESGRFPLENPMQGEAHGVLNIHGAEVRSGPLTQGYVMLARNIEAIVKAKPASAIDQGSATFLTLPPQQVNYRMVQNRVYHENLVVQSGDVRMVTSGWVDANQQMQLIASIPIQDNWIEKAPWLASMRGTALTVPISGTLQKPKLDSQVLEQLSRNMIDNAARGALQEGINRGLQELFRPR